MLPQDDKTPPNFTIQKTETQEKVKQIIRRIIYPAYNQLRSSMLIKQFELNKSIHFDLICSNQRGNDYQTHRRRVNSIKKIKSKDILILGCGTGKDLLSWVKLGPKSIIAVDYFRFDKAWSIVTEMLSNHSETNIQFIQADLSDLGMFSDNQFDIVGSDAVFEHLKNYKDVIKQISRILKKNGVIYATFGPLWHTFGGDHISGSDNIKNGFNHLILNKSKYHNYLNTFGTFSHNENDGRTWIYNDMFSYLKPDDYINILKGFGFCQKYLSAIISKNTMKFKRQFPFQFIDIEKIYGFSNLAIESISLIFLKKK